MRMFAPLLNIITAISLSCNGARRPRVRRSGMDKLPTSFELMPSLPSTLRVGVRDLCEFTARAGDLDVRFGMSPNAREGMAGHDTVTGRRGSDYEREVALKGTYEGLCVAGRADGYSIAQNRLEEIKTFRGDLTRQPANQRHLHWAQVKIYGWLMCERDTLPAITLVLVYFNIDTQQEFPFEQRFSSDA